ncbi:anhydro-N-acetylmuramic acid kinase, partial [bacterium]|nr:anhydro-N-acetylmuramic acid kinase [bacterium]
MIATASILTIETIINAYKDFIISQGKEIDELILTGGGALNQFIVEELKKKLPNKTNFLPVESFGMTIESREAISFAVLGYLTMQGRYGNLRSATGAKKRVILG